MRGIATGLGRKMGLIVVRLGVLGNLACGSRRDESAATDSVSAPGPPPTVPALPTPIDSTLSYPDLVARVSDRPEAVLAVSQGGNGAVAVVMRDGRRYHSTEPTHGALAAVVRTVDPAGSILVAQP